ncbi:hypothetical protein Z968_08745 [Clostridium novyi A str. 4552]|uniref:Uncharacterized protein n=1 Tax=Clostridium novyi A str. 4552 TaxID=1444289 RepID=A0A0A0I7F8_CLONO|nr:MULTISPECIES: hypothetical protein [Clostridium]KEH97867.1 hypothetical protein Z962_02045 [Clostridium botulinum C/D str. BKT12695]KGM95600.1 hypothetical protein Z968_08745 [Clostridium novyi A str. 4552]
MIPFKKVWEDSLAMISKDEVKELNIVETYKGGFVVKEDEDMEFINKDDFIYLWSKMICNNNISEDDALVNEKFRCVYQILKKLPYISESTTGLKIVD